MQQHMLGPYLTATTFDTGGFNPSLLSPAAKVMAKAGGLGHVYMPRSLPRLGTRLYKGKKKDTVPSKSPKK